MWFLLIYPAIIIFALLYHYFSVQPRKFFRYPRCGVIVCVERIEVFPSSQWVYKVFAQISLSLL